MSRPGILGWAALVLLLPGTEGASLVYEHRFGGTNNDSATAIATDRDGNVYVAGSSASLNFPVVGGIQQRNGGSALLLSPDAGKTWVRPAIEAAVYSVIAVGPAFLAATSNGVYRSGDAGAAWTRVSPALNYTVYALWADPRTPARLVAASAHGVLISGDGGASWRESNQGIERPNGAPFRDVTAITSPPGRPDTLFIAPLGAGAVYRSQDSGATWTRLDLGPGATALWTVLADPANPDVIYAGVVNAGVFKTGDGGNTWRLAAKLNLNYGPHTLAAGGGALYAARQDGLSRSTDGGETWTSAGFEGQAVSAVGVDWAAVSGALYHTTDGGAAWARVGPAISPFAQNVAAIGQTVFVSGDPGTDAFVTKWDPTGTRMLFSTYLGGAGADFATAIAVDAAGNIWVSGSTASPDFPVTDQSRLKAPLNGFVAKISPDGSKLLYATYLGGSAWDSIAALAIDANGAAYVAGYTESADFPVTPGAFQAQYQAGCAGTQSNQGDAFVAKFRAGGGLEYATYLGGACGDAASGIAVDASGNAYVAGKTNSPDFPATPGALQTRYGGGNFDGFVARLNAGGTGLVYATFLGGAGADNVAAVVVDAAGAAYVTGNSKMFSVPDQSSSCGAIGVGGGRGLPLFIDSGIYAARLTADGSGLVFGQAVGGMCDTQSSAMVLDAAGGLWLAGRGGQDFLPMVAPVQAFGFGNGFLTEMDPAAGKILFSTLTEGAAGLALDRAGNVYVAGDSALGDNPKELLFGQFRPNSAVVEKIDPSRTYALQLDSIARFEPNHFVFFGRPNGAAPGQLLRLQGPHLGPATAVTAAPDASGAFPFSLAGVEVRFDGQPATLLSVSDTEIDGIVPFAVAGRQTAAVQVSANGAVSNPVQIAVAPVSLELLGVANPDGSVNAWDNPAPAGSAVAVFVSGMGLTDPPGADGQPNPGPGRMLNPIAASIENNVPAEVLYAGPAPGLVAGVGQVNVALPASAAGGPVSMQLSSGQSQLFLNVYVR